MTLKKYDEIMDKIEVTDEMRNRILTNIEQTNLELPNVVNIAHKQDALKRGRVRKRAVSLAAGFVVLLLAGALIYPQLIHKDDQNPGEDVQQGAWGLEEFDSASALSKKLSFDIKDIPSLVKNADQVSYVAYNDDMAEITYEQGKQSVCYRKSVGTEDNSGDWNEYAKQERVMVGELDCTLKGAEDDAYTLAVWNDGTYAYSINVTNAMSQNDFETLIVEIEKNI